MRNATEILEAAIARIGTPLTIRTTAGAGKTIYLEERQLVRGHTVEQFLERLAYEVHVVPQRDETHDSA